MKKEGVNLTDSIQLAEQKLQEIWGYPEFRKGQKEAVTAVLENRDTLVLFPTGGGKSLCYQVPALVKEGLTLVISPLVALMQDQVQQLQDLGVSATFINNTIAPFEVEQRLVNARNGMYKLLYCSPERLKTTLFQNELQNLNVQLVAVDEAHCVSEWGHDFRPSYREIKSNLAGLPSTTSWIALTATATPEVRADIIQNLEFENPEVISLGFSRPNLKWWVVYTEKKREKLIEGTLKALKKGDGLIYGGTRRNCENWAAYFSNQGIKCKAYHAGVQPLDRRDIQRYWVKGTVPLVVATNAFGMGIDKPDCRFVIHEEMPFSIEAYYQEAGRAGRDGEEAFPILYYKHTDFSQAKLRIEQSYPTREQLEKVYQALCDSLELAVAGVMEASVPLDIESVKIRSKQALGICKSSLRLLDQFGIIAWEQKVKSGLSIQFILSRDMLQKFKERCNNPEKVEFVDQLERVLDARAFYESVDIEEEYLMSVLNVSRNGLVKALNVLMQNDQVLVFNKLEERDLVRVLEARSSQLPIGKDEVERHRKHLLQKLDKMNEFVLSNSCREVFLQQYFGNSETQECGHCDNCIKTNEKWQSQGMDAKLLRASMQQLASQPRSAEQLKSALNIDLNTAQSIIQYLLKEERIEAVEEETGLYSITSSS